MADNSDVGGARAYFDEFKAMQLENCSDADRPLWEGIVWADIVERVLRG